MVPSAQVTPVSVPKTPSNSSVASSLPSSSSSSSSPNTTTTGTITASPQLQPQPQPQPQPPLQPLPNTVPPLFQNPFLSGLGGNLGGANLPQMQQQIHNQLMQNPQLMEQLMNSPMMQQMQDMMLSNPEVFRQFIQNNPQTREMMDRHPEIAQLLNDPSILRQALQISRNPQLMRVCQHYFPILLIIDRESIDFPSGYLVVFSFPCLFIK